MKINFKKALLAGAVLTALCANAAFAADEPAKPTMAERTAAILHCNNDPDCPQYGHHMRKSMRRAPLTDEQIKQRQEQREQWQNMTPEERQKAREEWRAQRDKEREAAMEKLSPEQRQEVEKFITAQRENRDKSREQWQNMTPEQRAAVKAGGHHHKGHHFRHNPPADCPVYNN